MARPFLDIYRSIEQLYSAPKIERLAAKFSINCALSDLAEALESFISWRPKEEKALALLLGEVSQPVRASIVNAFFQGLGEASRWFGALRTTNWAMLRLVAKLL